MRSSRPQGEEQGHRLEKEPARSQYKEHARGASPQGVLGWGFLSPGAGPALTLQHLLPRENPRHGPRKSRKAEHSYLCYHLCPRHPDGGEACKAALLGSRGVGAGGRRGFWRRVAWQESTSCLCLTCAFIAGSQQKAKADSYPSRAGSPSPRGRGNWEWRCGEPAQRSDFQEGGTGLHDRWAEGHQGPEPCALLLARRGPRSSWVRLEGGPCH